MVCRAKGTGKPERENLKLQEMVSWLLSKERSFAVTENQKREKGGFKEDLQWLIESIYIVIVL